MTEVSVKGSQLDRIESGVNELNQRMARLEERQYSQGVKMETLEMRTDDHAVRLREIEVAHAVNKATMTQGQQRLLGRWAAVGAVALVLLSAVGSAVGKAVLGIVGVE
ncbi:hypothetical protein [uncultured Halomonas sp.]|uniref:hypothetical protein n=1 Tax=uncultured Halomonas sp. TaxID=173971 RepID=UPI0026371EDC|nr:hypothetical protein [uncultured Halomonas sp.]